MNANEITFGIEIETTIPATAPITVGPHGSGRPIEAMPGWKADSDPSIRTSPGRMACEFVSPVFKGAEGVRQLLADVAKIKALGAKVNTSCGVHIHVGFDRSNRIAMEKLTALVANFEKAFYAASGTKNRERGIYCRSIQAHGSVNAAILRQANGSRYHVCNFNTGKPTIEFRVFSASLNPQKLLAYVRMAVATVERSLVAKRVTVFTAKPVVATSPIHRSGDGQTTLTRMFYQFGWTKGRQPYTFGDLTGDGLPPIKSSKRELIRLARKYDQQP